MQTLCAGAWTAHTQHWRIAGATRRSAQLTPTLAWHAATWRRHAARARAKRACGGRCAINMFNTGDPDAHQNRWSARTQRFTSTARNAFIRVGVRSRARCRLFLNVQGAWIHPDAQPVEELMHVAKSCPSGAIRVVRNAAKPGEAPDAEAPPIVNLVRVRETAPGRRAELLVGGARQALPRRDACAAAANRPTNPFVMAATPPPDLLPAASPPPPAPRRWHSAMVRWMRPVPNGPLRVVGNLEVVSGTGRTCNKATEAYLRRCSRLQQQTLTGDGSHKAAGFAAP